MIPRSAWLIAAFLGLLLPSTFAQRTKQPVGVVPPQPMQLNVKVRREGKTEIPLRIHGLAGEPLQFLIRTLPTQGRLSEPRQTGRETAVAVYEPPADLTITADKFLYSVKSGSGVSAPVEVIIAIVDQPPQLTIPDLLNFSSVRTGATSNKMLEISNSGGALAIGEVIVEPPWRIEGKTGYRLAAGEIAIFKVIFAPATGGTFENVARFTSDPAHSTTLKGTAETSVAVNPPDVVLQNVDNDPVRSATLALVNQTDEPRNLQFKGDERLELPPPITLAPRAQVSVPIKTIAGDVRPLNGEIRIVGPDLELRVPVKAAASIAIVRAVQPAVAFGQVAAGKPATGHFELENIGGMPADVAWTVAAPFRMEQNTTYLLPGEKRSFDIAIESNAPGRFRGWIQCKAGPQTFEIALEAEVVGGMPPRTNVPGKSGSSRSAVAASSTPGDEPSPTPDVPEISNLPPVISSDWLADSTLPPGVKVSQVTPTTVTLEWPATLSPATRFRVDLRQFDYATDGTLTVKWLELGGLAITRQGPNYSATIHDLEPGQPWVIRILPVNDSGAPADRLFAIEFQTPPKVSRIPKVSALPGLLVVLAGLVAWQIFARWRRPRHG